MRQQAFASPQEALQHFGTKGMKWGVRKHEVSSKGPPSKSEIAGMGETPIVRTTASGHQLTLSKSNSFGSKLGRFINKNSVFLEVKDDQNKKVGVASFTAKKDELYLSWVTIDKSQRGKGYATEILKGAKEFGKAQGKKRLMLEVPPVSEDAQHIYTKMGFKVIPHKDRSDDDFIEMEYRFDEES